MKKKVLLVFIVFILAFNISVSAEEIKSESDQVFEAFNEVFSYILNYHPDDNSVEDLIRGAMKGMVDSLDTYSEYLTKEQYEDMQLEYEGHFGGIGIVITPELTVISPIKGTPGEAAGLQAEDEIIAIDGEPTEDMTQAEGVEMMRGEPGTEVTLTIRRKGREESFEKKITRADIEIPYVEWEMKNDEIGYISIAQFVQNVSEKVETAIKELEEQGAKVLILDLRSNPGGLLGEAVNVSSSFLSKKDVVSIDSKIGDNEVYRTKNGIYSTELPLVVLINQGSASGSEIVAGAIQDYERGILMGKKSFGKGSVQSLLPLVDGSAIKLTTGEYFTPADRDIHEKGVEVDIEIDYDPEYEGDNQLEEAIEYIEDNILGDSMESLAS
ncbi:MAG: S41 family peptidase [Halanaerobiales bacterium]